MARIVRSGGSWPTVFELDVGESIRLSRDTTGTPSDREIALVDVDHVRRPGITASAVIDAIVEARVTVDIDGETHALRHRPYQFPTEAGGLRLYVEATEPWASEPTLGRVALDHDVRLSACSPDEPWGPAETTFPIREYRIGSSTYRNTWRSLVPYNEVYYHRGEDFGAIPDRLPVVVPFDGTVVQSPLPDGDGESNRVRIEGDDGTVATFSHMNLEHIASGIREGSRIRRGDRLGKTGSTWRGSRSQTHDPHLHVGFAYENASISPYPGLVEAYFRAYPDAMVPIAGGYYFVPAGDRVTLDGTRSVARPGRTIAEYEWRFHDGTSVASPEVTRRYDEPGMYAEELATIADDGTEDRAYATVRVFDPDVDHPGSYGWAYSAPSREVVPGRELTFWNRLTCDGPVSIAFGDGTAIDRMGDQTTHAYDDPGLYTVTLSGREDGEPVVAKIRVRVTPADE